MRVCLRTAGLIAVTFVAVLFCAQFPKTAPALAESTPGQAQVNYKLSEATYESYLQEGNVFSFGYSLMVEPTQGVLYSYSMDYPYPVSNVTVIRAVESRVQAPLNYSVSALGPDKTRITVFFQKPVAFPGQQRFTLTASILGAISDLGSDSKHFSFTTENYTTPVTAFNFKIFLPRGWVMDSHSSTLGDVYGSTFEYGEDPGTGGWLVRWVNYGWNGGAITLNVDYSLSSRLGQIVWYGVAGAAIAVMAVVAYVAIRRWMRRLGIEETPGEA